MSSAQDSSISPGSTDKGEKPLANSVFTPSKPVTVQNPHISAPTAQKTSFVPRGARLLETVARDHPARYGLAKRVMEGNAGVLRPASKSQCIKLFCLDCMGFDSAAVRGCS